VNPDEFIAQVAGEKDVEVERAVRQLSPGAFVKAQSGGIGISELSAWAGPKSVRLVRYGHRLGGPASDDVVIALEGRLGCSLPDDLRALLRRVNGIHLWADLEQGRAYTGIAPVEEWGPIDERMYGPTRPRSMGNGYVAISYHSDGAAFLVLDVGSGRYFLVDPAGPSVDSPVARNVSELLEWVWRGRILPKSASQNSQAT
jgi:hypothetical protein